MTKGLGHLASVLCMDRKWGPGSYLKRAPRGGCHTQSQANMVRAFQKKVAILTLVSNFLMFKILAAV